MGWCSLPPLKPGSHISVGVLLSLHGGTRRPGGHCCQNQPIWLSPKVKAPEASGGWGWYPRTLHLSCVAKGSLDDKISFKCLHVWPETENSTEYFCIAGRACPQRSTQ